MTSRGSRSFLAGTFIEFSLLGIALLLTWIFRRPFPVVRWDWPDAFLGCAAAVPPLLFFWWTLSSRLRLLADHRRLLERFVPLLFGNWSVLLFALISLVAGICEEALFRGAIQNILAGFVGKLAGLALASVLFGCAHFLSRTYFVITTVIGAYLGLLWIWTGNLFTPVATHALYDFVALVYFLRFHRAATLPEGDR
jgi:membrane protease YdiL (CAAX protease family)